MPGGFLRGIGAVMALGASLGLGSPAMAADAPTHEPAAAASAVQPSDLQWRWDRPHRYYIETDVRLPRVMWLMARYNHQARAVAFQVRMILDCDAGVRERRRVREVTCTIDEIGLTAAAMPSERGRMQPVLDELDERLTGTTVELQLHHDGRILNIGMDNLDRQNRRVGAVNENIRLVLSRALAGLELQLPRPARVVDGIWPQYANLLMQVPTSVGTAGYSEVIHKIIEVRPDGAVLIESGGKGQISPGGGANTYLGQMVAFGTFDPHYGTLLQRSWTVRAEPTAGSLVAQGHEGLPYIQQGHLKLLGAGESVDVGETLEVEVPGAEPTTLQAWPTLGETPWFR